MWDLGRQRHCSDEDLLAHRDGELPRWAARRVSRHLNACWECRSRAWELEQQAHAVMRAAAETFPGPEHIVEAKRRFLEWKTEYERQGANSAPARRRAPLWRYAAVAAALSFVLAGSWLFFRRPAPEVVLAQAAAAERRSTGAAEVHQVLAVQMIQTRPVRRESSGRLEVWVDRHHARYASRWTDRQGTIRYANWQPSKGRAFQYDGGARILAATQGHASAAAFLDLSGYQMEDLERAFLDWIRSRPWQPIALSANFSLFAGRGGVVLQAERYRAADGTAMIRLTARRALRRVQADFVLEVDAASYRPRLQLVRFENQDRTVELRLSIEQVETARNSIELAVFEPMLPKLPAPPPSPRERQAPPLVTAPASPAQASADDEVEVLYALHRAGACRREVLDVGRPAGGRIRVRGLVADDARRTHIVAMLGGLKAGRLLDIDLATGLPPQARVGGATGLPAEATRAADAAYQDALALVRLAERFPPELLPALGAEPARRLQSMLRDHAAALESSALRTRRVLAPLLPAADLRQPSAAVESVDSSWNAACYALFRTVDRMDELIQDLGGAADPARTAAASELQIMFAKLGGGVRDLDGLIAREFPSNRTAAKR